MEGSLTVVSESGVGIGVCTFWVLRQNENDRFWEPHSICFRVYSNPERPNHKQMQVVKVWRVEENTERRGVDGGEPSAEILFGCCFSLIWWLCNPLWVFALHAE